MKISAICFVTFICFILVQSATAKEAHLKVKYSRYNDTTSVEILCNFHQMQKLKPCLEIGVGVEGKRITSENSPTNVFAITIHTLGNSFLLMDWKTCNKIGIKHDKGIAIFRVMETSVWDFMTRQKAYITDCKPNLSESKPLDCKESIFPIKDFKNLPEYLVRQSLVKTELLFANYCQMEAIGKSRKLTLTGCGQEYPIKPQYVSLIRRFMQRFPNPKDYGCKDGLEHGLHIEKHLNGMKKKQGEYSLGKKVGVWNEWHDNGVLAFTGRYENGIKTGKLQYWYKNKNRMAVLVAGNEQLLQSQIWYKDGKSMMDVDWEKGIWTIWYDKGTRKVTGKVVDGKIVGEDGKLPKFPSEMPNLWMHD